MDGDSPSKVDEHDFIKLKRKDLLEIDKFNNETLRELPCILPVAEPPKLSLSNILNKPPKREIPNKRKIILEVFKEAGIDVSRAVTISRDSFEKNFNQNPKPLEKLLNHSKNKQNHDSSKKKVFVCRKDFIAHHKNQLKERKKSNHSSKAINGESGSGLSSLERDFWNMEQKKAQILSTQKEFHTACSRTSEPNKSSKTRNKSRSVDIFDDLNSETDYLSREQNNPTDKSDANNESIDSVEFEEFNCHKEGVFLVIVDVSETNNAVCKSVAFDDELPFNTQNIKMLCSGTFDTQSSESHNKLLIEEIKDIPLKPKRPKSKFIVENFVEHEAEQSGSEISLGTDDTDTDRDLEDLIAYTDDECQSVDVARAHLDDMLEKDAEEIEAIRDIYFPSTQPKIFRTENIVQSDDDIELIRPEDDLISEKQESEEEIVDIMSFAHPINTFQAKESLPSISFKDAGLIVPEYTKEQKMILDIIVDPQPSINTIPKSVYTFNIENKILNEDSYAPNSHPHIPACLFISADSCSEKPISNDPSVLSKKVEEKSFSPHKRKIPEGSVFSLLLNSNK